MRFVIALVLIMLLALTQMKIWGGEGSVVYVQTLQDKLKETQSNNAQMRAANAQLKAELLDLREGTEILEEQARSELGMVKPNEVLIQLR